MPHPDLLLINLLFSGSPDPGLAALFAAAGGGVLPCPRPAWKAGAGSDGRTEFGTAARLDWYEGDADDARVSGLMTFFLEKNGEDWDAVMSVATSMARALAPHVDWLLLSRHHSDGPTCLPDAPLLRYHGHVLVATPDLIRSRYEANPLDWPEGIAVENIGGRIVAARALEAASDLDYLRIALPQNWALARQARSGAVRYGGPPDTAQTEIYGAAPASLHAVGYDPRSQSLEYSCFLEPCCHLAGWEIDALRWRLERGVLDTGEPLHEVHVVFADRTMAEREKRPLLDAGVKVLYMEGTAELECEP